MFVGCPEDNVPTDDPHGAGRESFVESCQPLLSAGLEGAVEDVAVGPAGTVHVPRLDHIHGAGEQSGYEAGHTGATEVTNQAVTEEVSGDQIILNRSLLLAERWRDICPTLVTSYTTVSQVLTMAFLPMFGPIPL